jgi:hypothetical protein
MTLAKDASRGGATAPRPMVAFDESGNTGQNLIDEAQPVFTLASVSMGDAEAASLLNQVKSGNAGEVKFARLRGNKAGQRRLLRLLSSPLLNVSTVRVGAYHKSFMVTTKMVDMLIENLLHNHGFNLYMKRGNLAMANLWHTVMPAFCGVREWSTLLGMFVTMVRRFTPDTEKAFYDQVDWLRKVNQEPDFDYQLAMLAATRSIAGDHIRSDTPVDLDPAIPAFFDLAAQWTAELNRPFDIAHDRSKPMAMEKDRLELVMTQHYPPQVLVGSGPKRQLPLLGTGIVFVDSETVVQVQLADTIAGALAVYLGARARGKGDSFAHSLDDTRVPELVKNGTLVWPTSLVAPSELDENDGGAALELVMDIAERERIRRANARGNA